jgi:hypothetical protein
MPAQAYDVPSPFACASWGATPAPRTLLPLIRSASKGTVLALFRDSVVPSLLAVIFWLIALFPPIESCRLCAVDCDVAAAAKAGATASAETVTAPMIAPNCNTRRFKVFPPGGAPLRADADKLSDSTGEPETTYETIPYP